VSSKLFMQQEDSETLSRIKELEIQSGPLILEHLKLLNQLSESELNEYIKWHTSLSLRDEIMKEGETYSKRFSSLTPEKKKFIIIKEDSFKNVEEISNTMSMDEIKNKSNEVFGHDIVKECMEKVVSEHGSDLLANPSKYMRTVMFDVLNKMLDNQEMRTFFINKFVLSSVFETTINDFSNMGKNDREEFMKSILRKEKRVKDE
jgi:hypothetical protein